MFELATGRELHSYFLGPGQIPSIEFDARGTHLITSGPGNAFLAVKIATGERTALNSEAGWISDYEFSPDGRFLAAGGGNGLTIWDARTWKELRKIETGLLPNVRGHVAFSRDSRYVAAVDAEGRIRFWKPDTGALVHTLGSDLEPDGLLEFTTDGRVLARDKERKIRVYGPRGGRPADRK